MPNAAAEWTNECLTRKQWSYEAKVQRELFKSCTGTTSQPCNTLPITFPEHVAGGRFNQAPDWSRNVCESSQESVFLMQAFFFSLFSSVGEAVGKGYMGYLHLSWVLLVWKGSSPVSHSCITLAAKAWNRPTKSVRHFSFTSRHWHRKVPPWPCSYCTYCMDRVRFALNSGDFSRFSSLATKEKKKNPFETLGAPDTANLLHLCCNIHCSCNWFRNTHGR